MIIPPVSSINSIPSSASPENQLAQVESQISKLRSKIVMLSQGGEKNAEKDIKDILKSHVSQLQSRVSEIRLEKAKDDNKASPETAGKYAKAPDKPAEIGSNIDVTV